MEDVPAADALAALPEANVKAKATANAEDKISSRSKELLQRMKELTWEYEGGLMVVDTFAKKLAVVPMKTRNLGTHNKTLAGSNL